MSDLLQVARELAQPRHIGRVIFHQFAYLGNQLLGARFLVQRHPVAEIAYLPLDLVGYRVGGVTRFNLFAPPAVFFGMGLRVGDHPVDLFLRKLSRAADRDLLLFAALLVFRGHRQDAVCIDIEGDFDLRRAARSRSYAFQAKVAEGAVVACQLALALQYVDVDRRLVILSGGKYFRLAHRYGRVALDEFRHDSAERLHAERERRHVEQHDVFNFSGQDPCLDRRADGDDLVRVDRLIGFFAARQTADQGLHGWHARRAAHE